MIKMEYAYSMLEAKAFDESADVVTVEGIASTPSPDRSDDVVEPKGAIFSTPMPLLWQHDSHKPVGHVTFAKPTKDGIPFKAEIPKVTESGVLKDRIDEAIQSLKYKLVSAVSISFKAIDAEWLESGGIHFKTWEWLELSLVTIPANRDAQIALVKSIDQNSLAALGREKGSGRINVDHPCVKGKARRPIQLIPRGRL